MCQSSIIKETIKGFIIWMKIYYYVLTCATAVWFVLIYRILILSSILFDYSMAKNNSSLLNKTLSDRKIEETNRTDGLY